MKIKTILVITIIERVDLDTLKILGRLLPKISNI